MNSMFLQNFTSLSSLIFCNIQHNLLSVDHGADSSQKIKLFSESLSISLRHRDPLEKFYLIVTYGFSLEDRNSCLN